MPLDFEELAARLIQVVKTYERLLIYIKGSPDPDAIAGSYALKLLCDAHNVKATIVSPKRASLPQNIKLIKDLRLPVRFEPVAECAKHFDAYAILDYQTVTVDNVTGVIPCAIHIDHHDPGGEELPVDLRILTDEVGSTSTLMIHLCHKLGVDFSQNGWKNAATALHYGVMTDTDDLKHAEAPDRLALDIIAPVVDRKTLNSISSVPFSKETMMYLKRALQDQMVYKDWMICGVGYINEKHRDSMGIIGDFLLKREDIDVVVVFGIVEKGQQLMLDASFRAKEDDFNLNNLIKQITRNGGARRFKGAYQVNLDYFAHCPDKEMLWKTVYSTTIETLKVRRDHVAAEDLQKLFQFLKTKIQDLFH